MKNDDLSNFNYTKKNNTDVDQSVIADSNQNEIKEVSIRQLREDQVVKEMADIFAIVSDGMVIPLFLFFWFADLIEMPDRKWETLALRLLVIPLVLFGKRVLSKQRSYVYLQTTMTIYTSMCAAIITTIIFLKDSPTTGYYVGLNLVALGSLSFIPFSWKFLSFASVLLYVPYYAVVLGQANTPAEFQGIGVNSFFIIGTLFICSVIRYFNENLRSRELTAQISLQKEIRARGRIIDRKTQEATQLRQLSAQFSPQVVEAIQSGQISIDQSLQHTKICVVFIDIVNSTEKVVSRSEQDVQMTLEKFLKTSINTLLKYDLTIDKFQGDGILAFSNSPVSHPDFIDRVCMASLEIIEQFKSDKDFYISNWGEPLQVKAGISVGYANVGFFGDRNNYSTFTAIGRPLSFASRLSSVAGLDQILVDREVSMALDRENFSIKYIGEKHLKGFSKDESHVYELEKNYKNRIIQADRFCARHIEKRLVLDLDNQVYFCRNCDYKEPVQEIMKYQIDTDFLNIAENSEKLKKSG